MRSMKMNVSDSLMTTASILLFINLLLVITGTSFASSDVIDGATNTVSKDIDGRERTRVESATHELKFNAANLCNFDVDSGLCLDIWGNGDYGANGMTAKGNFLTHVPKQTSGYPMGSGTWTVVKVLTFSDSEMTFKARTTSGSVFVQMIEGKSENSGKVCAYGDLLQISQAADAVCVDNAKVTIEAVR